MKELDTYDANGNTVLSAGISDSYDFENHLVQKGAVTVVYDGDGNRVIETAGGVTTNYLVDTQNPTGYAQVVDELQSGAVTRSYSYGMERISESQALNSTWTPSFYGYDGHGSVRQLTNAAGAITDTYDYDAFGNLTTSTGSTPNNYLFAGEQYDPALSLYYNRARYLNTATGRFWSMDSFEGGTFEPKTLHHYSYASNNPVNRADPSGMDGELAEEIGTLPAEQTIDLTPAIQGLVILGFLVESFSKERPNQPDDKIFFRGTTAYDAAETVLYQAIDIDRLLARQSDPSQTDFGSGLYMTKSYQTADIFAQRQGLFGRQGGPAVLLINVSNQSWNYLLTNGAKEDAPISNMPGHFQDFVPINLVEYFNISAKFALAPAP